MPQEAVRLCKAEFVEARKQKAEAERKERERIAALERRA